MKRERWEFWVTWVLWSVVMVGVGMYLGFRCGIRDERDRIANTPPAASNWWKAGHETPR